MSQSKECDVRIENAMLTVPVMGDPDRTQKLAEELTVRIQRISKERNSFNSYHFVLQAALELAHERDLEILEREKQDQEIVHAMSELVRKIRSLINLHTPKDIEGEEDE
ncbi:MAG: cell division protein ZapA [Candidatus Hydrogenedentes bacterium]|nr:cell division protein ZapA [Candidatus Hydrogenedentota bacterium]